jgi:hypothetical protein
VPSRSSEKFEEAAHAAPSCAGSFKIMKQRGSGASGDVGLAVVVTERCEAARSQEPPFGHA